jgi:hypothetical protein
MSGKPELSISALGRFLSNWRSRIAVVYGDYKGFFASYPSIFSWRLEGTNIRASLLYGTKQNTLAKVKLPEVSQIESKCIMSDSTTSDSEEDDDSEEAAENREVTAQSDSDAAVGVASTSGELSEAQALPASDVQLPSVLGGYTITMVSDVEACVAACVELMECKVLAVDCEGLAAGQKPELLQILGCSETGEPQTPVYIFKVRRGDPAMTPIIEVVLTNSKTKLFHDCRHDINALNESGIEVVNVTDTQVMFASLQQLKRVARLPLADPKPPRLEQLIPTNDTERHAWFKAARRLKKAFRTHMHGRGGDSLWGTNDFTDEMLEYAAFDVAVLPVIWKNLREETARTTDEMYHHLSELFGGGVVTLQSLPTMFK